MSERDIRNSFRHLQEDVMSNVDTEARLGEIARQKKVRPALAAFAGAAAVVLIVGAAWLALRPVGTTDTLPPATVVTTTPPTSAATTTTEATTTTSPATALPNLSSGTVVLAVPDLAPTGPRGVSETTMVFEDGTVGVRGERVVGDGSGGLFVQTDGTIQWWRQDGTRCTLVVSTFSGDNVELRLEDVTVVDGDTNVLFVATGGQEVQRYEEVWRYDVATATPTMLYHTGAYEREITRASLENNVLVLTQAAEGFTWFEFFDADGNPIELNNPKPDGANLPVFVDQGVLSPGGTTLVYLQSTTPSPAEDNTWDLDIVAWNLADGRPTPLDSVGLLDWFPGRMDYDGTRVVLGRIQYGSDGTTSGTALWFNTLERRIESLTTAGVPSLIK
jgi:hypothetical protein